MQLDVCLTPSDYQSARFAGRVAVVIDVFRATSSIASAFVNGCEAVIPVETVDAAHVEQRKQPGALLAGERDALKVPGFDLGNSPAEFTPESVRGKRIIMSTTNGTVALVKAAGSAAVYTAAFVNAAAVCRTLRECNNDIVLLCAGRKGMFSMEDALCAGLLADRLADTRDLSDTAQFARAAYLGSRNTLLEQVQASSHAQYLQEIGYGSDVAWCLEHDILDVVPLYTGGLLVKS